MDKQQGRGRPYRYRTVKEMSEFLGYTEAYIRERIKTFGYEPDRRAGGKDYYNGTTARKIKARVCLEALRRFNGKV